MARRKKYYYYGFDFEAILVVLIVFLVITIISKYYIYLIVIGSIVLVYFLIRMIINSDIFGKFRDVKLYYNGDTALKRLEKLEKLEKNNEVEYKINCIKKGINGENKILYTLLSSLQFYPKYFSNFFICLNLLPAICPICFAQMLLLV